MQTIRLEAAPDRLAKAVEAALSGEEVVFSKGSQTVARIAPLPAAAITGSRRVPGLLKGQIIFHPGWDEPLEDFAAYR